jgi:hypothetical protein
MTVLEQAENKVASNLKNSLTDDKITEPFHVIEAFIYSYRHRGIHSSYFLSLLKQDLGDVYEDNTIEVHHSTVMGTQPQNLKSTSEGKPSKAEIDRFITNSIRKGHTVRKHTHPKTKGKWIKRRRA